MEADMNNKSSKPELPVIPFASQALWEQWLDQNHSISNGIWLQMFKKDSGIASVNYAQALDVALCYGWIDGQLKSIDGLSYMQRFTPRRPRSIWSKRNIEHIARLSKEGRMKPAGIKQAEVAEAFTFYQSLNKANKYAIAWRIQTAKRPETRKKRMKEFLEMLAGKEKFHM
jgi:uncharacterized protein YdeI (YjbR/CyaY-like superfamily)